MTNLDDEVRTLARLAGLHLMIEQFPDDLSIAFSDARRLLDSLPTRFETGDEPWPPMRARIAR